jgi:hypothetical protein
MRRVLKRPHGFPLDRSFGFRRIRFIPHWAIRRYSRASWLFVRHLVELLGADCGLDLPSLEKENVAFANARMINIYSKHHIMICMVINIAILLPRTGHLESSKVKNYSFGFRHSAGLLLCVNDATGRDLRHGS